MQPRVVAAQPVEARRRVVAGEQQPFLVRGLAQHLGPEVAEQRLQLRGGPSALGGRCQQVPGAARHLPEQQLVFAGQCERRGGRHRQIALVCLGHGHHGSLPCSHYY